MPSERLTPAELDEIEADHTEASDGDLDGFPVGPPECSECRYRWPCMTARLVAHIRALDAELAEVRAERDAWARAEDFWRKRAALLERERDGWRDINRCTYEGPCACNHRAVTAEDAIERVKTVLHDPPVPSRMLIPIILGALDGNTFYAFTEEFLGALRGKGAE